MSNRQSESAGNADCAVSAHKRLKVSETRTRWCVQGSRAKTSERDHDRIAHATKKGHRVCAAASATSTRERP